MSATALTTALFVALVVVMVIATVFALRDAWAESERSLAIPVAIGVLLVHLLVPALLALTGRLDRYTPMPPPAMLLIAVTTLVTVALVASPIGLRLATALPLATLVGFQSFRIGVEWLLHRLWLEGAIPVVMTWSGRNLDVVAGASALGLGWWLRTARGSDRRLVFGWNVLGLLLLANIVVIAVLATPTDYQVFRDGPDNTLPGTWPFVWLPSFLVQLALAGHLLVFRRLRWERRRQVPG
jgi:hypothetical protein